MVKTEHPTREEWAARQAGLPDAARATLAALAEAKAKRIAEEREREERERAEVEQWRADFEAAVAAALVAAGAEWLVPYRVPDHECGAREFTGNTNHYLAVFDASALGCWPVAAVTYGDPGKSGTWEVDGWRVHRPSGTATFAKFAAALEVATTYTTPF